jgi:hypothetical protein
MKNLFTRIWRWVRWPLLVLAAGFAILVAWRLKLLYELDDTNAAVAKIHATHLTWDDVFGPLPVEPDKAANDATLAGIDVNGNGIRDDVERAIYFKYKDSAKEAAPAFQYAKALQMEFTDVYNSATLVAVMQEESRASLCLSDREKKKEIGGLVFNTQERIDWGESIRQKYMTTYSLPHDGCDLDPDSLEN